LKYYEEFNHLAEELYNNGFRNDEYKNSLAISCLLLGDTHSALGDDSTGFKYYKEWNRFKKSSMNRTLKI